MASEYIPSTSKKAPESANRVEVASCLDDDDSDMEDFGDLGSPSSNFQMQNSFDSVKVGSGNSGVIFGTSFKDLTVQTLTLNIYQNPPPPPEVPENSPELELAEMEEQVSEKCALKSPPCQNRRGIVFVLVLLFVISVVVALLYYYILLAKNELQEIKPDDGVFRLVHVNRTSWGASDPKGSVGYFKGKRKMVIVAHTVYNDCFDENECGAIMRAIQKQHMENFSDIGYNFVIGGDAKVYEGRGWTIYGAHTLHYNTESIGVAFNGNYQKKEASEDEMRAFEALLAEGVTRGELEPDFKILAQRQISKTLSPGDHLFARLRNLSHWSSDVIKP